MKQISSKITNVTRYDYRTGEIRRFTYSSKSFTRLKLKPLISVIGISYAVLVILPILTNVAVHFNTNVATENISCLNPVFALDGYELGTGFDNGRYNPDVATAPFDLSQLINHDSSSCEVTYADVGQPFTNLTFDLNSFALIRPISVVYDTIAIFFGYEDLWTSGGVTLDRAKFSVILSSIGEAQDYWVTLDTNQQNMYITLYDNWSWFEQWFFYDYEALQ